MSLIKRFLQALGPRGCPATSLVRLLVTAVGITLVATQIDAAQLWQGLLLADWRMVGMALLIFQGGIFIRAMRWRALLGALGTPPPLLRLVALYYAGAFFNAFLPTGFGGDVVRVVEIGDHADVEVAVATVGLDRLSGLCVLVTIGLLTLPLAMSTLPAGVTFVAAVVCAGGLAGWILLVHTDIPVHILSGVALRISVVDVSGLARLAATIRRIDRRALRKAVGASFAFNLLLIITYYAMSLAFRLGLPIRPFAIIATFGSLLLLLPSIQGLGVREPVYVLLLGSLGIKAEQAVAFSVGIYMLGLSTALVGGAYYAAYSVLSMTRRRSPAASVSGETDESKR